MRPLLQKNGEASHLLLEILCLKQVSGYATALLVEIGHVEVCCIETVHRPWLKHDQVHPRASVC
jgi:hypothetical protein